MDRNVNENEIIKEFHVNNQKISLHVGNDRYGLRHILKRYSGDYFPDFKPKGSPLFPPKTNRNQLVNGLEEVLKRGDVLRPRPDDGDKFSIEAPIVLNNVKAPYRIVVDRSQNKIITFYQRGH